MKDTTKTKKGLIPRSDKARRRIARPKALQEQMERPQSAAAEKSSKSGKIQVSGIKIQWESKQGICSFEDLPVAMMWVDTTLAGVMAGVQAMVGTERFALALQSEGRKSVEADWKVISKYPDFKEGFKAIANIATVAGWGKWELISLDRKKKECLFRVMNSWEGRYQKALGVCWGSGMLAGKMAGFCSRLFGNNCWAEQKSFIAKGDAYDEFVVKPSPRSIEKEIDNLLASDNASRADMAVALRKLEKEIAGRNMVEEALRKSEERFRALTESTSDWIWEIDSNGVYTYSSPRIKDTLGYEPREIIGRTPFDLMPPDEAERLSGIFHCILDSRKPFAALENANMHKDGRLIILETSGVPILDRDGNFSGYRGIDRDITDRKKAEDEIIKNLSLLNSTIESTADGILVVGREGKVERFNRKFLQMWNIPESSLESQNDDEVLAFVLDQVKEPESFLARVKEVYVHPEGKSFDVIEFKDGRYFERYSQPQEMEGKILGRVWSFRDVTDRKKTEEALKKSEVELKKRVKELEEFYNLAVGRELRMVELKKEMKRLKEELQKHKKLNILRDQT